MLKHSDPNGLMMLRVTTLFELVSLSCMGWSSDLGLVPM